jgi:hypothetical protein
MVSVAEEHIDDALSIQSIGFGLLSAEGGDRSIDYSLYEVSHQNIGIISNERLEVGQRLSIDHRDNFHIPLVVHQIVEKRNLPPGYRRYRLISLNPDINFEQMLPESNHRKVSFIARHDYRVRFARFITEVPIAVDAKTFGGNRSYLMKTINVSKSGFLLASAQGLTVPFHETTLLELKIILDEEPGIPCLGKVIRYEVDFEHRVKLYGVTISEISPDDRERYSSLVEDIEHRKNRQVFRQLRLPMPF